MTNPIFVVTAAAIAGLSACGAHRPSVGAGGRYRDAPGVSLDDLATAARELYVRALNALSCPCGDPHSLGRCIHEHRTCRLGPRAAQVLARLVREGYPEDEITERYRGRFLAPASQITVDEALAEGPANAAVTVAEFADFQ